MKYERKSEKDEETKTNIVENKDVIIIKSYMSTSIYHFPIVSNLFSLKTLTSSSLEVYPK